MDHAEAHERIADLALEPARLVAVEVSTATGDRELLEHLGECAACRAELDAWRRLQRGLGESLPAVAPGNARTASLVDPILAPESLRSQVLAAARSTAPESTARRTASRPPISLRVTRLGWLGVAAVVAALLVGGALIRDQAGRLDAARAEASAMADVVAAVDRVLAQPGHRVATLVAPDGVAGGSVSWSRHDLVVLATALPPPRDGGVYRCWLSDGASGWAVGVMEFAGGTAYWVGTLDEWATFEIGPNTTFRVSLEPAGADPTRRAGPIVLEASLRL